MIDATLLFGGTTVYSPWFPRRADMLRVVAECVAVSNADIEIQLFTKNVEDVGDGADVDENTSITLSAVGRSTAEWKTVAMQEGVEQLLRFKFIINGEANAWILYRLHSPVWFDAVAT